jgi:hypothetical protein
LSDDEVDYMRPKTNANVMPSPRGNTASPKESPASPLGGFGVGVSRPMVQDEEEENTTGSNTKKKTPHVALLQAAAKNDVQTIQRLIDDQQKQQQQQQQEGDSNNQQAVSRLVNYCDEVGQTALHCK